MLNHLFTFAFAHAGPDVKCKALVPDATPAETVANAHRKNKDPKVRHTSMNKLNNLETLATLATTEPLPDIREAAMKRQRALLAGPLQTGPLLEARLEFMRHAHSSDLHVHLAQHAQVIEVRMAALQQVTDSSVLCTIATKDPVAAMRQAAVKRIWNPEIWETIAREGCKKDKHVSRIVRERLSAWRKACSHRQHKEL